MYLAIGLSLLSVYRRTENAKIDIMCLVINLLLAITLTTQFQHDVRVLASDRMEGRGLGTHGIELAADWIESQLRTISKPAFPKHSYRQPFEVKTGVALADGNQLPGVADADWAPLGMSSSGPFQGEVAFAGYGIAAPPLNYDD